MLSFFTCPKGFVARSSLLQRNAILSWIRCIPEAEIILLGNDEGTREFAREIGAVHLPDVQATPKGVPLISDLFEQAQCAARFDRLCYINSDIVLTPDFRRALERLLSWNDDFLAIGECLDIEVPEPIAFTDPDWAATLTQRARSKGRSRGRKAMDFFVFNRGLFKDVPQFAIGRLWFDNWLVWNARRQGCSVVDITPSVVCIHQNHDYSHAGAGQTVYSLPSADVLANLAAAGGYWHLHSMHESTHRLTDSGVRRSWAGTLKLYFYLLRPWTLLWHHLLDLTRPVRHALGLRAARPR
ncbi:MAG: hypothetical protein AMXMBFR33_45940 [Candidatus Xenobia bacterium]